MHDENFAPCAALPTFIAMLKCAPLGTLSLPPGAAPPLSVVDVDDVDAVVVSEAMLAIPGEPPPPPQPAARNANAPAETVQVTRSGRRQRMLDRDSVEVVTAGIQELLPACNPR